MKTLFHILFDTAWGPAVAWLVASVIACLAFTLLQTSSFLVVLPVLLAALVVLAAFVLSLVRRHWLRALLQLLLVVAAQVATGGAYVPLLHCRSASAPTEDFDEAHFGEKQWELVRETGLDFPEGARGLRLFCDYRCAFDCSCAARIALPGDASTAIAAQLEKLPAKQEQVSGLRTQELDWWPQDAASNDTSTGNMASFGHFCTMKKTAPSSTSIGLPFRTHRPMTSRVFQTLEPIFHVFSKPWNHVLPFFPNLGSKFRKNFQPLEPSFAFPAASLPLTFNPSTFQLFNRCPLTLEP